jgi:hypothetical protein
MGGRRPSHARNMRAHSSDGDRAGPRRVRFLSAGTPPCAILSGASEPCTILIRERPRRVRFCSRGFRPCTILVRERPRRVRKRTIFVHDRGREGQESYTAPWPSTGIVHGRGRDGARTSRSDARWRLDSGRRRGSASLRQQTDPGEERVARTSSRTGGGRCGRGTTRPPSMIHGK